MSPARLNLLPMSGYEVDRDHLTRSRVNLFEELRGDPNTKVLSLWRSRALTTSEPLADAPHVALDLLPADQVEDALELVYLGRTLSETVEEPVGTVVIAAILSDSQAMALEADEEKWAGLLTAGSKFSARDAALFTEALAMANWHDSHGYSPRTGERTLVEQGGWVRRSASDNSEVFPRTDPAVIVRILDHDDRILLGSNALWAANRYSLLAGFVEPGESLEAAVVREMFEECGLRVSDPVYLGSQAWPFPASLMCGFEARLAIGESPERLNADGEEILDVRWFSRDQLREELPDLVLPGPMSIACAIIEDWYGGPLDER